MFESIWPEHPDFEVVLASRQNSIIEGSSWWDDFFKRVSKSSKDMVKWHRNTFCNAQKEIDRLTANLQGLLNRDRSLVHWDSVSQVRKRIDEVWKHEESYWGQRS